MSWADHPSLMNLSTYELDLIMHVEFMGNQRNVSSWLEEKSVQFLRNHHFAQVSVFLDDSMFEYLNSAGLWDNDLKKLEGELIIFS
jgi:hypothetical protein